MHPTILNISKWRTRAAVIFACAISICGMSGIRAAETVIIKDYMTPNGEGSSWIYARSVKGKTQGSTATRISVVEDHYLFRLPTGSLFASQKLEERGKWENGRFAKFKGEKRDALFTYTGTGDRYRFLGTDDPVPGSPGKTENRLRFENGFATGPTMKIGERNRKRSLVYLSNKLLGSTDLTMELLEKGPVKVPAGTFRDCIRLRFTIGAGKDAEVGEEWWAKGVGLVKWKGVSGEMAGISEALVSMDLKEVIPYSPPGLSLTGEHLYEVSSSWGYQLQFPPIFIPGTLLEETVILKNTGSETLKGVTAELISNPHFMMDPFEKRDLEGGESVVLKVRLVIPAGPFEAITRLEIKCGDSTVEPIIVPMSLSMF
jgi:hypothetical protein